MNKSDILKDFAKDYGQARPCMSCEGIMVPTTTTLRRDYKGVILTLLNFPVFQCKKCMQEQHNTSKLIKYVKAARNNFDTYGIIVLDCDVIE